MLTAHSRFRTLRWHVEWKGKATGASRSIETSSLSSRTQTSHTFGRRFKFGPTRENTVTSLFTFVVSVLADSKRPFSNYLRRGCAAISPHGINFELGKHSGQIYLSHRLPRLNRQIFQLARLRGTSECGTRDIRPTRLAMATFGGWHQSSPVARPSYHR